MSVGESFYIPTVFFLYLNINYERFRLKLLAHILPNFPLIDLVPLLLLSPSFASLMRKISILALLLNLLFQGVMGLHCIPTSLPKEYYATYCSQILALRG